MFPSTRLKLYNKITVGKLEHIRNEGLFSLNVLCPLSKMLRSRGAADFKGVHIYRIFAKTTI